MSVDAAAFSAILDKLVAELEGPAAYVFEKTVTHVYLDGVGLSVLAVGLVLLILLSVKVFLAVLRKKSAGLLEAVVDWFPVVVVFVLLCVILTAISITFAISAVDRFINPEYYAIKCLIEILK